MYHLCRMTFVSFSVWSGKGHTSGTFSMSENQVKCPKFPFSGSSTLAYTSMSWMTLGCRSLRSRSISLSALEWDVVVVVVVGEHCRRVD
jgi:hypothetical protein